MRNFVVVFFFYENEESLDEQFWLCRTKTFRFKVEKFFSRSFSILVSFALFDSLFTGFFPFGWKLETENWENMFYKAFVCDSLIAIRTLLSESPTRRWNLGDFLCKFSFELLKKTMGLYFNLSLVSFFDFGLMCVCVWEIIRQNKALSKSKTMTPKVALLNGQRQNALLQILSHCEYRTLPSLWEIPWIRICCLRYSRFVDLFNASSSHFAICSTSYMLFVVRCSSFAVW